MKIKLVCKKCNTEVNSLSVSFDNICFRKDLTVVNHHNTNPFLVEYDKEYFSGGVEKIFYDCKCGHMMITKDDDKNISDFISLVSYNVLNFNELSKKKYGNLKVIITNKSEAGCIINITKKGKKRNESLHRSV